MKSKVQYMKRIFPVSILILIVVLMTACGSKSNAVNVGLTTYKIDMSTTQIKSGEVTFHITNKATDQEHEFVIFKTDLDAGQLPKDADGNVDEAKLQSVDEAEVPIGETKDLTVNLQPGHYVAICNMPGHYSQAMYQNFTVQ